MNRIDHRPTAAALNGIDGSQMQRHMLQELERQWLDSWGVATAEQPDAGPAAPNERDSVAGAKSFAATDAERSHATAASDAMNLRGHTAEASKDAHGNAQPADRRVAFRDQAEPSGIRADRLPGNHAEPLGNTEATLPRPVAPTAPLMALSQAWLDAVPLTPTQAALAPLTANAMIAAAGLPHGLAPPLQAGVLARQTDPDVGSPASRAHPPSRTDSPVGPQRFTLRELAPDLVQATLRDAQLDLSASQVAARGLARALMEAGYAQVKVVVNGQHSRGGDSDADDVKPPSTAPATLPHPFSEIAPKDHAHGN